MRPLKQRVPTLNWIRQERPGRLWTRRQLWSVVAITALFALAGVALLLVVASLGFARPGRYVDWNAVTAAATVSAALATAATLGVIALTLPEIERGFIDSRADRSPYVRVDVVPTAPHRLPEFRPGTPYYHRTDSVSDFAETDEPAVRVSAWFRNYQSHPLGFAIGVTAVFVLERLDDASGDIALTEVSVPFLECLKPVKVDLFQFPLAWRTRASLARLNYTDLRKRSYERALDGDDEVMHGRFECSWDGTAFTAAPDATWPTQPLADHLPNGR